MICKRYLVFSWLGGAGYSRGLLKKTPRAPPKLPKQKGLLPSEGRANIALPCFVGYRGVFRAPVLQYRLWFVPLSLIDFFEASPYGVFADGGGEVKMHGTRWQRDARERVCSPTARWRPSKARSLGRASQRAKLSPRPFSFCQAFSFGPTWAKEKAGVTGFAFCAAVCRLLIHRCRGPPCLAAARSRSGSDTTPWCHSLPSRRFATHRRRLPKPMLTATNF